MIEVRFHGRGGQGAVVASRILADAAFREGKYVQTFPFFGVERRGAPVTAFTRIDEKKIRIRTQIYEPGYVVVLDPTLFEAVDVIQGLKPGGMAIINTDRRPQDFDLRRDVKVRTCDATSIALKYGLGSRTAPIANTPILGAFSKATGLVGLDSIAQSIKETVPTRPEANIQAAREAYELTPSHITPAPLEEAGSNKGISSPPSGGGACLPTSEGGGIDHLWEER